MEVQVDVLDGFLAACLVVVATAASVIAAPMQQHAMRRIRFRRMPVLQWNELGLWHRASAESVHEEPIRVGKSHQCLVAHVGEFCMSVLAFLVD